MSASINYRSAAEACQLGSGSLVDLAQEGGRLLVVQDGNDNLLSSSGAGGLGEVTRTGDGNRVDHTRIGGGGLAAPVVVQSGGAQVSIVQTGR